MAVDVVVEEVADNLEELAEATRRINRTSVGFFVGGFAVGAVFGFFWGYRYNKEAIKAEAYKQSEKEVAKIRDLYQAKVVAAQPKPTIEEMIEEGGYSVIAPTPERPLPPPVPVQEPVEVVIIGIKASPRTRAGTIRWSNRVDLRVILTSFTRTNSRPTSTDTIR